MITTSRYTTLLLAPLFILSTFLFAPSAIAAPADDVSASAQEAVEEPGGMVKSGKGQESKFTPSVHLFLGVQLSENSLKEINEELASLRQEGYKITNLSPKPSFVVGIRLHATPSLQFGVVYQKMSWETNRSQNLIHSDLEGIKYEFSARFWELQSFVQILNEKNVHLFAGMGVARINALGKVGYDSPAEIQGSSIGFRPIVEWQFTTDVAIGFALQVSYLFADVHAYRKSSPGFEYTLDLSGPSVSLSMNFDIIKGLILLDEMQK